MQKPAATAVPPLSVLARLFLAALALAPATRGQTIITYTDTQVSTTARATTPANPLTFTIASGTATENGVVSGTGSLTKTGAGFLRLGVTNTYSGGTFLSAGTIELNADNALGTGAITITGGGLRAGGQARTLTNALFTSGTFTVGRSTTFAGTTTLTANTTIIASNPDGLANSDTTFSGAIGGNFGVTLAEGAGAAGIGTGYLVFSGTNTYTGGTTLNTRLSIASDAALGATSGALTMDGGTLREATTFSSARNVTLGAGGGTLDLSGTSTFSGTVSGSGSLTKSGTGTLTLSGANTYTGGTVINAGTLQVGDGSTGSLASTTITVGSSGILAFNQADQNNVIYNTPLRGPLVTIANNGTVAGTQGAGTTKVFYGKISGSGQLVQSGAGTTYLWSDYNGSTTGLGNTYTGGTLISAGTLIVGLQANLGSGPITNNGALVYSVGDRYTGITFAEFNTISGTGALTVPSSSVIELWGNNSYTGATTIDGQVTLFSATGLGSSPTLTLNGTLETLYNSDLSLASLSGSSSSANFQIWGGGNYRVGGDNTSTTFAGWVNQLGGGSSGSFTKIGTGSLTIGGGGSYGASTIVSAGTLQFGTGTSGDFTGTSSFTVAPSATLAFGLGDGKTVSGSIANGGNLVRLAGTGITNTFSGVISGAGGFTQNGAGTTVLSGANTYTGATTINGGILSAASATALSASSTITLANTAGTTLKLNDFNNTIGGLAGGGASGGSVTLGNATLTVAGSASTVYDGAITGAGKLVRAGTGTTAVSQNLTFTGNTTITSGTLQLGNGGTTGAVLGNISNNGTLAFKRSDAFTYSNAISGTGGVSQIGNGTLTLSGTNTYTGATTINGGKLLAGSASGLGNTSSITLANTPGTSLDLNGYSRTVGALSGGGTIGGNITLGSATLTAGSDNTSTTYGAAISGSGGLTKTGSGTLNLTGTNSYTGATTISGGTLVLHGTNTTLPAGASLVLEAGKGVTTTGGQVTGWQDQSNAGNNATVGGGSVTTGTLSNGAPTLVFNGSSFLNDPLSGSKSTFSIFAVVERTGGSTSTNQTILGSAVNGNLQYAINGGSQTVIKQGGFGGYYATTPPIIAGTPTILGVAFSNNTVLGFYQGTLLSLYNVNAGYSSGGASTTVIGAAGTGSQYFTGNISALIVYDSALGFGSYVPIQNYLNWKYFGGPVPYTNTLSTGTTLSLTGTGAALDLNGGRETVASLSGVAGTSIYLGDGILTVGADNTSTTFAGAMSDAGGLSPGTGGALVKNGTGTLTLSGNNTNTGSISINAGTLQVGSGGTTGTLASSTIVNNAALVFNRSDASSYTGIISGLGNLTKTGTGTLTLTGANTYSGGTTISFGTVRTSHVSALGTGAVTVSGATSVLNLAGTTIANPITVQSGGSVQGTGGVGAFTIASGGNVSPGNSPGTLTAGATTFGPGGSYTWQINSASPGGAGATTGWDLLSISGALNITATSGSPFTIALASLTSGNLAGSVINFNPSQNSSYTVATASGGIGSFSANQFVIDATGFSNATNGGTWSLAAVGNNLNLNFTASAIPEPSTYAALAGACALGLAAYRKRQRRQSG